MRLLALLVTLAAATAVADDAPVKLPPGTRSDGSGAYVSARGLRDTTEAIAKELSRRGIAVQQIGPYRARGAEVTRFVSQTQSTTWLAIHVLRTAGKTVISFVPRPSP